MTTRVRVATQDLFFRTKLLAVIRELGAEAAGGGEDCDLAVVELGSGAATEMIRSLVGRGVPVLAFGSHRSPAQLRAARDAGAEAVPNSEVERRLRGLLTGGA